MLFPGSVGAAETEAEAVVGICVVEVVLDVVLIVVLDDGRGKVVVVEVVR